MRAADEVILTQTVPMVISHGRWNSPLVYGRSCGACMDVDSFFRRGAGVFSFWGFFVFPFLLLVQVVILTVHVGDLVVDGFSAHDGGVGGASGNFCDVLDDSNGPFFSES